MASGAQDVLTEGRARKVPSMSVKILEVMPRMLSASSSKDSQLPSLT